MFKKLFASSMLVLLLSPAVAVSEEPLPEVGSTYKIDKASYTVLGVSASEAFEVTASGESLQIVVGTVPGTIVIVPKKGDVVKIDPSVPMVWIAGAPHKEFASNPFLKRQKNARILLLEYQR